MKISVFLPHLLDAARQENLPLDEIFKKVRAMGYEGIEGDYAQILPMLPDLKKLLSDTGMAFSSVYTFQQFQKGYEEAPLLHLLDSLLAVPCKKLMVIPGFFTGEGMQELEMARMIDGLSFLCEAAMERGITVTVENFGNPLSPCFTSEGLSFLLNEISLLQYTFDTGNFYFAREDAAAVFPLLSHRLAHAHIKNYSLQPLCSEEAEKAEGPEGRKAFPASGGEGILPIRDCIRLIREAGYEGYLTVEQFGCARQMEAMEKSIRFIQSCL